MNNSILHIAIIICFSVSLMYGQFSNNGALISVKSGAKLSIHEEVVNYNGGTFHNTDTIYAFDDWTNNAGNEAFTSTGIGIVYLYGDNQRIKGTSITRFYDLRLDQTGVKYGDLDVYVDGFLRLKDRQFHLNNHTVHVFNPQLDAVQNIGTDGYVSAVGNGGLSRFMNLMQPYFFPVGWPGYYRPAELTLADPNSNAFKIRMAFTDATLEGFDREERASYLCEVNPTYYHRINRELGVESTRIKLHYDPSVDGTNWNTIARWQNLPQWEDIGDETDGIDPVTTLNYFETFDFISDFTLPAFALGANSDTLELVANDTSVCSGSEIVFTTPPGLLNYEFFLNGNSVQNGSNNTYSNSTLVDGDIISFTAVADECVYQGSEITVTIFELPVANANSNSPVCEHGELTLSASGGSFYQWEGPDGFTSTESNPIISDVLVAATGTYSVTVTDDNGCTDMTTTTVEIFPEPVIEITDNSPVCETRTISVTSTGGITYQWEGPNGFTFSASDFDIPNATPNESGTYSLTVTDGNGCTSTSSIDIEVLPAPPAAASNTGPACNLTSLTINAIGGTSYEWEGPNGFTSNDASHTFNPVETAQAGTYTVTVTDDNGCTATATTEVEIFDLPVASTSNNSPVCEGSMVTLTASGGTSFLWEGPLGFSAVTPTPTLTDITLAQAGDYTVTVTDDNGCTSSSTTNVIVHPNPDGQVVSNSPVCEGSILTIEATGGTGYLWNGPGGFVSSSSQIELANANPSQSGTYSVTITNEFGCVDVQSTDVTVLAAPPATAENNGPACNGQGDIMLNSTGGVSYQWSGPSGFSSSSSSPTITAPGTGQAGTYTVTVTDGNGCTATASTDVQLFGLPNGGVSSNAPICAGDELILEGAGGVSYEWSGPDGFMSSQQVPTLDNAPVSASGNYTVTVTDINGCTASASTTVIVSPYPVIDGFTDAPLCEGSTINLGVTGDGDLSYWWTGPLGFVDSTASTMVDEAYLENEGSYIVSATNPYGCISYDTVMVTMYEGVYGESYGDTTIYAGSSVPIGITGDTSYTYQWTPFEGLSCDDCPQTIATLESSATYEIVVTTEDGCTETFTISIQVEPLTDEALVIPNVITPNGDGFNDTWEIDFIHQFEFTEVVILNRWGDEIFYAQPYENDFDGTFEGRDLPEGTYYYILRLGQDNETLRGNITILRE